MAPSSEASCDVSCGHRAACLTDLTGRDTKNGQTEYIIENVTDTVTGRNRGTEQEAKTDGAHASKNEDRGTVGSSEGLGRGGLDELAANLGFPFPTPFLALTALHAMWYAETRPTSRAASRNVNVGAGKGWERNAASVKVEMGAQRVGWEGGGGIPAAELDGGSRGRLRYAAILSSQAVHLGNRVPQLLVKMLAALSGNLELLH